jgi:hypothetical protein
LMVWFMIYNWSAIGVGCCLSYRVAQ